MIELIRTLGDERIHRLDNGAYHLYSGNRSVDLNTIKSILSKYKIKPDIDETFRYNFSGEQMVVTKISHERDLVYIIDDTVEFRFTGMNDLITNLKKYGTEKIEIENNGIRIKPRLQATDRYNFNTVNGEKVSVGNFMVHFGDFLDGNGLESFFRYLYARENKLIDALLQKYAPIIKNTNFENILGYAQVNKFYRQVNEDNNIQNYSPLPDAKYCILMNDAPITLKFDRVENNSVIVNADIIGEFRYRSDLPQFDPYIIFTSRKMPSLPSFSKEIKLPRGNGRMTIGVYVSILKFTRPEMFKDTKYSIDLLSSPE